MIKIAICDDEENCVKNLGEIIYQYAQQNNLRIEIKTFLSGVALLETFNEYDLIFLDIDMPEKDGIETARVIRKKDIYCNIIYVTNHKDFTHQAFSVRAFGYIIKPFTKDMIEKELNDFMITLSKRDVNHQVVFKGRNSDLVLNLEDIHYFEVVGKNILEVTLNDKKETIYCSLSDAFEKVKKYPFAMPHQSYIINLHFVNMIVKLEIAMRNGNIIPIAQKRSKAFRERHSEFLQDTFTTI